MLPSLRINSSLSLPLEKSRTDLQNSLLLSTTTSWTTSTLISTICCPTTPRPSMPFPRSSTKDCIPQLIRTLYVDSDDNDDNDILSAPKQQEISTIQQQTFSNTSDNPPSPPVLQTFPATSLTTTNSPPTMNNYPPNLPHLPHRLLHLLPHPQLPNPNPSQNQNPASVLLLSLPPANLAGSRNPPSAKRKPTLTLASPNPNPTHPLTFPRSNPQCFIHVRRTTLPPRREPLACSKRSRNGLTISNETFSMALARTDRREE
jgi:hypothetical protein